MGRQRVFDQLTLIQLKQPALQLRALQIRIGLNCAEVLVGNIGASDRFSYTAIGDGVNVAARLEGMNKTFGTTICISDSVFNAVASETIARPAPRPGQGSKAGFHDLRTGRTCKHGRS